MLATLSALAAICVIWPQVIAGRWGGAILFHLLLLAMLLIGTVLRDRAARFLERAAVVVLLAACGYVMSGEANAACSRRLCC